MPDTSNPTVAPIGVLTGGALRGASTSGGVVTDSGVRKVPPYPVAALIRRTRNAKSSRDLHDIAFNGWEASMRLAVAAKPPADPSQLFEPSTGTWAAALRATLPDYKLDDPHLRAAYSLFSRVGAGINSSPMFVTPKMLFEFIASYRNQLHGHGAVRGSEFYDTAGELLLHGLEAAWRHWIFLPDNGELVFVQSVELDAAGMRRARIYLLKGGEPMLENRLGTADTPDGLRPNRLYLRVDRSYTSLHPWLLYDDKDERERVLYYNGRNKYLDFISGETPRVDKLQDTFPSLYKELDALFKGKTATILPDGGPAPDDPNDFGDYEIIGELGRGGMATVCLAKQKSLDRRVALKIPLPGASNDPVAVQRFAREIQVLSQCDHPNVVKILDSGVHNGTPFYVMEYIEGADLARISKAISVHGNIDDAISSASLQIKQERAELLKVPVAPKPPPTGTQILRNRQEGLLTSLQRLIVLFRDAARGLHHLHQHNIIHRDIKPGNLMLTEGEHRIVVMDLGLAALSGGQNLSKDNTGLLGTLRYMAPEQLQRQPVSLDRRADIYSLCATFYELLARKPFLDGASEQQLLHQIIYEEPMPLGKANPMIPRDIQMIVAKGINKDPRMRYQTAEELGMDLNRWLKGEPIAAREPSLAYLLSLSIKKHKAQVITAGIGLLMVGAIAAAALLLYRHMLIRENQLAGDNVKLARNSEREAVLTRAQEQLIAGASMENDGKFGLAKKKYENARTKFEALGQPTDETDARLNLLYLRHRPPLYYFEGHRGTANGRGSIRSVALSPIDDSVALTSGEEDGFGIVKLWDLHSGQESGQLRTLPNERVMMARFTPDGKKVLLSGWDSHLTLWDPKTGQSVKFSDFNESVLSIAFSPGGKYVATGTFNGVIRIWELDGAKEVCWVDRQPVVRALAFGENGTLCSGGSDGLINLWKIEPAQKRMSPIKTIPSNKPGPPDDKNAAPERGVPAHKGGINALAFVDNDTRVISCGDDRLLKVWGVDDGKELSQGYGHQSEVIGLGIYDRDKMAATASGTTLRLWNLEKISEPTTIECGWHESAITGIAVLSSGKRVLTASADGSLMMWPLPFKRFAPFTSPEGKVGPVRSVDLSASGTLALSCGEDEMGVRLWDAESGIQLRKFAGLGSPMYLVSFSPDEKQIFGLDLSGRVLIWKIDDAAGDARPRVIHEGKTTLTRPFIRGAFSPDGRRAAMNATESIVDVVDLETGNTLASLAADDAAPDGKSVSILVSGVSFSGDGSRVLTSNMEGTLRLWDVATGKKLQKIRTPGSSAVFGLVLTADGKRAIAGGMDFVCRLWDLESGQEQRRFEGHNNSVFAVAYSSAKHQIATGSLDQSIRFWDERDGRELHAFHGLKGSVSTLTYSNDGEVLLYGCRNGLLEQYDLHQAAQIRKLEEKIARAQARLKLNKEDFEALSIVGEWLSLQGAWRDATDRMDAAKQISPGAFAYYSMLGKCYWLRAKNEPDPANRRILLKNALDAYRTERDRLKAQPVTPETERELIRYTLIVNAVEADIKAAQ